jgi:Caspase domain
MKKLVISAKHPDLILCPWLEGAVFALRGGLKAVIDASPKSLVRVWFWFKRVTRVRLIPWCVCALVAALLPAVALAGMAGNPENIEFDNNQKVYSPSATGTVRFRADEYAFGGGKFAYLAVAIAPLNSPIANPRPQHTTSWDVYGILVRSPELPTFAEAARSFEVNFVAPNEQGTYRVLLSRVPTFHASPLTQNPQFKTSFRAVGAERKSLLDALLVNGSIRELARIQVSKNDVKLPEVIPLYLKVDNEAAAYTKLEGGLQDKPILLSWFVGDEFQRDKSKVLFRYRMEPEDTDYGAWTSSRSVGYSYLHRGYHRFLVQAKYTEANQAMESLPANFQFTLSKDHVSPPTRETLTKGIIGIGVTADSPIAFNELYTKSRALLIGTWKFDDSARFAQFDKTKISADVSVLKAALVRNGFEVTTLLQERVRREDMSAAISKLVADAGRDDRLLVYFSTHGFPDPLLPSKGFLATADCSADDPRGRCFALSELSEHAERALNGKRVRQVLFAVDSCFSGLGISQKSVAVTPNLNQLAKPQGAFMLTAGMADQLAQIDPQLGMSTFTHYLAEGLNGKADILGNNGLITLSELFVYVQYKVAERTQSKQIPMLGRISGDGEMLFMPSR